MDYETLEKIGGSRRLSLVVDVMNVAVDRPPVQEAVRPVEPGVVQIVQHDSGEQQVRPLRAAALVGQNNADSDSVPFRTLRIITLHADTV